MKIEFKAGDTITIPEGCKAIVGKVLTIKR